jgi:hypothetical protein
VVLSRILNFLITFVEVVKMVSLAELWMVVLLAGVLCWFASASIHMFIKYHNADYQVLSNEPEVSAALVASSPKPALYTMPYCLDMQAMSEQPMQKKFDDGPVAMITVMPNGMPPMSKLLSQQIVFFIIGSLLIAFNRLSCVYFVKLWGRLLSRV